ncbi:MAG: hypothetical protein CO023_01710 [Flavobacteriales bacterium CG_4_9_14_0_2_um_filter_35_242]|nr:MAG: hypothetical protein AUJ53_06910 [Flavobacteriaceae bacterium CG1_02_35_72]PJA05960.1 MAG: hypothetical protein COX71_03990 [Flavobacteriales bacterium CG_4_10_14_0_2_um_filter_35_18]PJC60150.1 MAG: hypothetical protein CO023_01710 [Flavobacteriales bacterium CG_4_9_14_0_2_um_filter_35_242]
MKKQFLGIFFYMLYILAMFRPLLPIIDYYSNYNYIAKVLCENRDKPYLECNGKCYLAKQLNEVNNNKTNPKSTIPQIDFDKYPVSPLGQFSYKFKILEKNDTHRFSFNKFTLQEFYNSLLKPPQFIS